MGTGSSFSKMSRDDLLAFCRRLYDEQGLEALSYPQLKKIKGLYWNLYSNGLNQKNLIRELGLHSEFSEKKGAFFTRDYNGEQREGWTWDRILKIARDVKEKQGFLPPAGWFQKNGYASLVVATYYLGRTWEDLRIALNDFGSSSFVESRNGMRWRSHPEASLSNFLYARGITHKKGSRYPEEYAQQSRANYAYFDLHVKDKAGNWLDIEIWGDKPNGHGEQRYGEKREDKEAFNRGNPNFIGIHFKECFDEISLNKIFAPHIGQVEPFVFDRPTDKTTPATHWSNTDELLEYCRDFASKMPGGKFPTEEWLRKRGKWANRSGEAFNTLSVYIKTWFGGVRKLRELLGQAQFSTTRWDRSSAIAAYKEFYEKNGATPSQVRHLHETGQKLFSSDAVSHARRICSAVGKYAGGVLAVNKMLDIKIEKSRTRRSSL